MKSYLKLLLLLLSALLLTARCEEEGDLSDEQDGDLSDEQDGELDGDLESEEGDDEYAEEGDEGAEWQPEKKEPLSVEQMHALHKKIDAKGNGKVSIADATEFAHKMRRAFAKKHLHEDLESMDIFKSDGKVSLEEFHAYFLKHEDDEEQNAGPTKEEEEQFAEERTKQFKESDKNNDGVLDAEEVAFMHHHYISEKVETEMTKGALKERDQDSNGELTMHEFHEMEAEGRDELSEDDKEIFSKLDKDGSGTLNHAEFAPWLTTSYDSEETVKNLFAAADQDDDDLLTAEELAEAREKIASGDHQLHLFLHEWHEGHGKHEEL